MSIRLGIGHVEGLLNLLHWLTGYSAGMREDAAYIPGFVELRGHLQEIDRALRELEPEGPALTASDFTTTGSVFGLGFAPTPPHAYSYPLGGATPAATILADEEDAVPPEEEGPFTKWVQHLRGVK